MHLFISYNEVHEHTENTHTNKEIYTRDKKHHNAIMSQIKKYSLYFLICDIMVLFVQHVEQTVHSHGSVSAFQVEIGF